MENTNSNQNLNSFQKQKNKEEMKKQLISFTLMIVLTLIAFAIVAMGAIEKIYVIPLLIVLAVIQVGFQFYYFMHMKDKDHGMPATIFYGGVWAALLTLAGLGVVSWW